MKFTRAAHLGEALRNVSQRMVTQRNGSFVNLMAPLYLSQRSASHLGVSRRYSMQHNGIIND
jgi:hypothetical protein